MSTDQIAKYCIVVTDLESVGSGGGGHGGTLVEGGGDEQSYHKGNANGGKITRKVVQIAEGKTLKDTSQVQKGR